MKVTIKGVWQEIAKRWLLVEGVRCPDAEKVLAAMAMYGLSYGEALRAVCRDLKEPRDIEAEMDEAVCEAGHSTGARRLLEELYREAIQDEDGIRS